MKCYRLFELSHQSLSHKLDIWNWQSPDSVPVRKCRKRLWSWLKVQVACALQPFLAFPQRISALPWNIALTSPPWGLSTLLNLIATNEAGSLVNVLRETSFVFWTFEGDGDLKVVCLKDYNLQIYIERRTVWNIFLTNVDSLIKFSKRYGHVWLLFPIKPKSCKTLSEE